MANKCGECLFFQGSGKCGGGYGGRTSSMSACNNSFKGPVRLLGGKKCGGCRLFEGSGKTCGGGYGGRTSNISACSNSYSPIPG